MLKQFAAIPPLEQSLPVGLTCPTSYRHRKNSSLRIAAHNPRPPPFNNREAIGDSPNVVNLTVTKEARRTRRCPKESMSLSLHPVALQIEDPPDLALSSPVGSR